MKTKFSILKLIFLFILFASFDATSQINISNRAAGNVVVFGKGKLMLTHDYNGKCNISKLDINNQNVISVKSGKP